MAKTIKNRKTIYVVVKERNDGGSWMSFNVKAFDDKEVAEYYTQQLNETNDDDAVVFSVEELTLVELA